VPRPRASGSSPASSATPEAAACFRAADLVVLPYREIDQSGVLFTALGFGKPLLLTDIGASLRSPRPARPSSSRPPMPPPHAALAA